MSTQDMPHLAPYTVRERHHVGEHVWEIWISTDEAILAALKPGMFVDVAVPGDPRHLVRIPLSYYDMDLHRSYLKLYVVNVGEGTKRFCHQKVGSGATLIGPLGHGWELPKDTEHPALLVAGGSGAAPIYAAARMFAAGGIDCDVVMGAQSGTRFWHEGAAQLATLDSSADVQVFPATDDGSYGFHGFPTQLMERLVEKKIYGSVLCCGPNSLMEGVATIAAREHIPCQVSLERVMACGFGACNTCSVAMKDGSVASCCQDGPVFDAEEVEW